MNGLTPYFIPSDRIGEAVAAAALWHGDQRRKQTRIPYLSHLLATAAVGMEFGANETETVAALLHDSVEDANVQYDELEDKFGSEVTSIVRACSTELKVGDPELDAYRPRKQRYIDHIASEGPDGAPHSAVFVSLADKIHNARSTANDYLTLGETLWDRFTSDRHDITWYYRSLIVAYRRRAEDATARISPAMIDALERAVNEFADDC